MIRVERSKYTERRNVVVSTFRLFAIFGLFMCGMAGCSDRGEVKLIPLGYRSIDAQTPMTYSYVVPEAYYWITPENELRIGLTDPNRQFGDDPEIVPLNLSFVLDGVPASTSRDYPMDRNTLRGKLSRGMQHVRFASIQGVISIWMDPENRIHGKFRAETRYQSFNVLIGWKGGSPVLVLGEFEAELNEEKTGEVVERTESAGMERNYSPPVLRRVVGPTPQYRAPKTH